MHLIGWDGANEVQIFQNLISNALKFVEKDPVITIDGNVKDNEFIISVKDNGIGINKEYEHKIFNLFHQLISIFYIIEA